MISKSSMRGWTSSLVLFSLIVLCSCNSLNLFGPKVEDLKLDHEFSSNIFKPGKDWPGRHYALNQAQEDLMGSRGMPDLVRLWFNPLGDFRYIYDSEIYSKFRTHEWNDLDRSWIYLDDYTEYTFSNRGAKEQPVSDMLRIMIKHGDPQDAKYIPKDVGPLKVEWIYYQQGLRFLFVDDVLTKTTPQRPINYTRR